MGFQMYKAEGDEILECSCDDRQEENMKKAGWQRVPPEIKSAPVENAPVETAKPVKTSAAAKPAGSGDK